jgi:hypothetical protein
MNATTDNVKSILADASIAVDWQLPEIQVIPAFQTIQDLSI